MGLYSPLVVQSVDQMSAERERRRKVQAAWAQSRNDLGPSGIQQLGGPMSQERLDTVLRWITLLWVIATLVLITATWVSVPQLLS
ncbi:MAG TPA: hypothetical protein VGV15_11815 [Terriglobales bacterium]|nr:hypothetical protein [Terriglobales bacterium]